MAGQDFVVTGVRVSVGAGLESSTETLLPQVLPASSGTSPAGDGRRSRQRRQFVGDPFRELADLLRLVAV